MVSVALLTKCAGRISSFPIHLVFFPCVDRYFSTAVATPANRQKFSQNILGIYKQYHLDGVDIDWEYPGQEGNKGNRVSSSDTANFLSFLQTLRAILPPDAKITAATMTVPFADSNGSPRGDVSAFGKVLDWILIMNYDTWGCESSLHSFSHNDDFSSAFSVILIFTSFLVFTFARCSFLQHRHELASNPPGPNAPLNDGCHNSTQPHANAAAAVDTWTKAGFPASRIVLGVPSYAYISRSTATSLRTRTFLDRRAGLHLSGAATDDIEAITEALPDLGLFNTDSYENGAVLVTNEDGGTDNGQVQFRELLRQGALKYIPDSDASDMDYNRRGPLLYAGKTINNYFTGDHGFTRYWDQCSGTPFLRSEAARQVISYDDPQSLEIKATFARQAGLLGVNMFDVHGDTDHWDLIDGLRRGLGLS